MQQNVAYASTEGISVNRGQVRGMKKLAPLIAEKFFFFFGYVSKTFLT